MEPNVAGSSPAEPAILAYCVVPNYTCLVNENCPINWLSLLSSVSLGVVMVIKNGSTTKVPNTVVVGGLRPADKYPIKSVNLPRKKSGK